MTVADGRERGRSGAALRVKYFFNMLVPSLDDIREHQPVVPPLVIGWVFVLISTVSLRPLMLSSLSGDQAALAQGMEVLMWLLALAAPLIQLLKAGVFAALGWAVLVLANSSRRIRPIFSVLLYGEAILAAQGVLLALFLHYTTGGSVASPDELQVSLGLAAFVPASQPFLYAVAQGLSVVHLLWFAFLVMALGRCDGPERRPSLALACFFWGVTLSLAAARTWIAL